MSHRRGPVRLIVKSRRVPVALTEIEFPQTTSYRVVSTIKKRSIVYDYVLDEGGGALLRRSVRPQRIQVSLSKS